jgi:hypothetical protein
MSSRKIAKKEIDECDSHMAQLKVSSYIELDDQTAGTLTINLRRGRYFINYVRANTPIYFRKTTSEVVVREEIANWYKEKI